LPFVFELGAGT